MGLGCLGIIVLIVVIAVAGGSGKKTDSTVNNQAENTGTSGSGKTTEVTLAGLKQEVQDGDLAFTVNSVETSKTLGNSFISKTAQGEFYVVTLKLENKGKKTTTFDSSMAKVTDSEGREFERSIDGTTAKGMSQGNVDLFLQQIQPGLSVTGDLVFDLPENVSSPVIVLKGSLFSTGVKVKLT